MTDQAFDLVVLTEADDARLAGWVQSCEVRVERGTKVRVDNVSVDDDAFAKEAWLWALVSASFNGGPWEPWTWVFFERPTDRDHRSIDGLAAAFAKQLAPAPLPEQFEQATVFGGDWPQFDPPATQSIFDQLITLRAFAVERHDDRLTAMLNNAYAMGRAVRQEELRAQHENDARRGAKVHHGAARGGRVTGQLQSAATRAWRDALAAWLQPILNEANAAAAKHLSRDRVAALVEERWPQEGFGGQRECPERGTLLEALKDLEARDVLKRPAARPGRRRRP